MLRLCRRVGAQLCSLECDEKPQRRFEVPGIPLRPDSCEQAFPAARRFECQLGRALEKGGSRSQAAARLRPSRGAVELLGDVLVGAGGSVSSVPRVAVRVELGVCRLRQGAVRFLPPLKRRRPVRRRTHQRMAEAHACSDLE